MKYTKEVTDRLVHDYNAGIEVKIIANNLQVPVRSVIAKLSSLGVYKKKQYVNKQGNTPIKKATHIQNISKLLDLDLELCESLEKVNKLVLSRIECKLEQKSLEI